jgi:hypothetical protein
MLVAKPPSTISLWRMDGGDYLSQPEGRLDLTQENGWSQSHYRFGSKNMISKSPIQRLNEPIRLQIAIDAVNLNLG